MSVCLLSNPLQAPTPSSAPTWTTSRLACLSSTASMTATTMTGGDGEKLTKLTQPESTTPTTKTSPKTSPLKTSPRKGGTNSTHAARNESDHNPNLKTSDGRSRGRINAKHHANSTWKYKQSNSTHRSINKQRINLDSEIHRGHSNITETTQNQTDAYVTPKPNRNTRLKRHESPERGQTGTGTVQGRGQRREESRRQGGRERQEEEEEKGRTRNPEVFHRRGGDRLGLQPTLGCYGQ